MGSSLDTQALGFPVELSQLGREIKKLWERESQTSTRASLINFAVFCRGPEAMQASTDLLMEFTRHHACRAILIGAEPDSSQDQIRAWINAHCHLSRAGAKQVCCEQVSFYFEGRTGNRIANVLYANLDSDLPLYLWWQGDFPAPIDVQLWAWVDRLIFDSQSWAQPRQQFSLIREALSSGHSRLVLCDLNWTRSLHLRQAIAQMFDCPENLTLLASLNTVTISHAPGFHSTALLLVGWLAAQLKLELHDSRPDNSQFTAPGGRPVRFVLKQESGRSISRCELHSDTGSLLCQRDTAGDFFRMEIRHQHGDVHHHLLPSGSNAAAPLLLEEIAGGGPHRVYLRALAIAEPFF